jgi:DNA-binding transcriptional regulator YdaS (Cro superfamily)
METNRTPHPDPRALADGKAQAIAGAGSTRKLAKALTDLGWSITGSAISQWDKVPAERVVLVEKASGVSRTVLRPDLFDGVLVTGDAA